MNTMTSTEQVRYLDPSYPKCLTPSRAEYLFTEYTAIHRKDKSIKNFLPYNKVSSYSEYSTQSNLDSYRMLRYILKTWYASPPTKDSKSRMVYKDKESGDLDKVVLTMQGYLMKKDLPPLAMLPK